MHLHTDFSRRVVVDTNALAWVPSPTAGVARRMLERDGGEVARATSLVRYAPRSRFPAHTHGGGEEFLVLAGVFADERGEYPAGTYVRNPIGSSHAPFTEEGCTILVKLRQMTDPAEPRRVIDTRSADWPPPDDAGRQALPLYRAAAGGEQVCLLRLVPGAPPVADAHPGGCEAFVLEGELRDEAGTYPAGTWMRLPAGSAHRPESPAGCLLWVKRGHLPPPDAGT